MLIYSVVTNFFFFEAVVFWSQSILQMSHWWAQSPCSSEMMRWSCLCAHPGFYHLVTEVKKKGVPIPYVPLFSEEIKYVTSLASMPNYTEAKHSPLGKVRQECHPRTSSENNHNKHGIRTTIWDSLIKNSFSWHCIFFFPVFKVNFNLKYVCKTQASVSWVKSGYSFFFGVLKKCFCAPKQAAGNAQIGFQGIPSPVSFLHRKLSMSATW